MLLLTTLFACNGDDPTNEPPPDFNYIPADEDFCLPEDLETANAAVAYLDEFAESQQFMAATHFTLCSEDSCAPCSETDNPTLEVLRDVDEWGDGDVTLLLEAIAWLDDDTGTTDSGAVLEAYFNRALGYPYRYLLVSVPDDASGSTTMTWSQGIATCDSFDCDTFSLAQGALTDTCDAFIHSVDATVSDDAWTSQNSANPFAFAVPLDEDLPDPDSFADRLEIQDWLNSIPSLTIMGESPSVDITLDDDGNGCATMTGKVSPEDFGILVSDTSALDDYTDSDGLITVKLSAEMIPASIQ